MRKAFAWSWRLPLLGVLAAAAVLAVGAGKAQAHVCYETVNPAGNPAVGDNHSGDPNDPFGGDAVPGGRHTSPGNNGNGPVNSDGFYVVGGDLFLSLDGKNFTPLIDPDTAGKAPFYGQWPVYTTIKFTQWAANKGVKISSMAGPHSVIQYQIQAWGDLYVSNDAGGYTFCGVPPPTF